MTGRLGKPHPVQGQAGALRVARPVPGRPHRGVWQQASQRDGRSRQNPAYRPATEEAPATGLLLYLPCAGDSSGGPATGRLRSRRRCIAEHDSARGSRTSLTAGMGMLHEVQGYRRCWTIRGHAEAAAPFGGCKPSPCGVVEIAVATSSSEARRHRRAFEFSLAMRHSSYFCAAPKRSRSTRCRRPTSSWPTGSRCMHGSLDEHRARESDGAAPGRRLRLEHARTRLRRSVCAGTIAPNDESKIPSDDGGEHPCYGW